ncbi:MAG: DNA polymerase III subunit gamma/tau [Sphingomonadaceae bacterium]
MASESPRPYRVLARKYRPQGFDELIGQDAMVKTLANAIRRDRLAHAFLLTGVRGVGKTSTARLIAKALNCVGPDGEGGPTIEPCGQCEPCRAIAEGRHIDVVEMDAASHTGVEDVREIIEAVRYASVSARYKIYIVDEVHMLSKSAFNALLKTLEEPPAHVKFLFATTEVAKVPLTVLSRCQRFDLKRIPAELLARHFGDIAKAEEVEAEAEALALIARAAEGSARDGLSILDQAIAHGEGRVTAGQVRAMLGLADRAAVRELLQLLLAGDAQGALAALAGQYDLGVEPAALLRGLLEAVHGVTRAKLGGAGDPAQAAETREAYAGLGEMLGYSKLHRLWQLLLKGLDEVNSAPIPLEAAEMALLRVIHAAELPDPGELVERLEKGEIIAPTKVSAREGEEDQGQLLKAPADFRALEQALAARGHQILARQLHDEVGLVRYQPPELAIRPLKPMANEFARDLAAALKAMTGERWTVQLADAPAEPSLREQERDAETRRQEKVRADPLVEAAFEAFPDAELTGYDLPEHSKG